MPRAPHGNSGGQNDLKLSLARFPPLGLSHLATPFRAVPEHILRVSHPTQKCSPLRLLRLRLTQDTHSWSPETQFQARGVREAWVRVPTPNDRGALWGGPTSAP